MAAEVVGGHLSNSRVFAETAPNPPLLVAAPDLMGAAFADIHKIHSPDSFAAAALGRLESFLESAEADDTEGASVEVFGADDDLGSSVRPPFTS